MTPHKPPSRLPEIVGAGFALGVAASALIPVLSHEPGPDLASCGVSGAILLGTLRLLQPSLLRTAHRLRRLRPHAILRSHNETPA